MQEPSFEEQYEDVLQNIENQIVQVYHKHRDLTDYEVQSALDALIKTYQGEARGKPPVQPRNLLAVEIYTMVHGVCEWRLGREQLLDEKNRPVEIPMDPLSKEEMIACLKRVRKSVETWNKQGGRQGYLNFIENFIP